MDRVKEDTSKGSSRKIDGSEGRSKTMARRQFFAEDLNKAADEFIKNFRKQLKIEREESLKRYRETIARGT